MYKKIIVFMLVTLLLLTGCWDKVEVEERAHISAIGIDKYIPCEGEDRPNCYVFTFAFPEHKKDDAKDIVVSSVGENLYGVSRIMASRSNKDLFLGHLRVVILSDEITKSEGNFRHILDGIENNRFLSRSVILAMTEGSAKDVIEIIPAVENRIGEFVAGIFRRTDRIPRIVGGSSGDILKDLHESGNTIIPKVIPGENDLKIAGGGIINDFKFRGWLGEVETAHLLVLKGQTKCL